MRIVMLLSPSAIAHAQSAAVSHERVAVRISPDTAWATIGLLIGRADVYPESIVVTFDSTSISQISHELGRSKYHLDSMTVGLAIRSGRSWDTSAESDALSIPDSLAERVTFSPGRLRFHIRRPSGQAIRGSWLVVTYYQIVAPFLVPREQQGGGTTYTHSDREVFSAVNVGTYTASAPVVSAHVPARISSLETTFVTRGAFIGTAEVYPESVVVVFDSTFVTQQPLESGFSTRHLDSMTVGLASSSDGRWRIGSTSPALTIADSLAERESFSLGKVRFMIPRQPGVPLRSRWLVVTFYTILSPSLVPRERQGGATTYAHSGMIFSRLHGR